jgi:CRISPR-associated protein Cmr5
VRGVKMSVSDLERDRSQYAFGCVKNVYEFNNKEEIFKKYLEKKFLKSQEKDEEKREEELKKIKKDIESFLNKEELNFQKLSKENLEKAQKSFGKDYKSYVKKIPMMILNNGLGATSAFIYSKSKDGNAYELIDKQIKRWFQLSEDIIVLIDWIINQNSQEYRATTNEVLALFNWLKRFAEGMIEKEKNSE